MDTASSTRSVSNQILLSILHRDTLFNPRAVQCICIIRTPDENSENYQFQFRLLDFEVGPLRQHPRNMNVQKIIVLLGAESSSNQPANCTFEFKVTNSVKFPLWMSGNTRNVVIKGFRVRFPVGTRVSESALNCRSRS